MIAKPKILALIVVGTALNIGLGFLVSLVKLPFYLDSIGTVLVTFLGGLPAGLAVAILSVVFGSLYTPTTWAYVLTAMSIACFARVSMNFGYLDRVVPTVLFGLAMGVMSAVVSAPVTVFLFGGMSAAGADALTATFQAMGKTIMESVVLGGLASDPVDKLVTSLIAYAIVLRLPLSLRRER